jgi:hypothetical protein
MKKNLKSKISWHCPYKDDEYDKMADEENVISYVKVQICLLSAREWGPPTAPP